MDETLNIKKYNAFWGTIMICIIYAIIALGILLFSYFTEVGKNIFINNLSVFTTTFIIGTLCIIIVTTILVIDWKPEEDGIKAKEIAGPMSCPDYWKIRKMKESGTDAEEDINNMEKNLQYYGTDVDNYKFDILNSTYDKTNVNDKGFYEDNNVKLDKNLFKNVCELDTTILNSSTNIQYDDLNGVINDYTGNLKKDEDKKTFIDSMFKMSANTTYDSSATPTTHTRPETELKCDRVFPEYLAKLDAQEYADNNFKGKSNKYRCEYAKVCNVPWTSAGC